MKFSRLGRMNCEASLIGASYLWAAVVAMLMLEPGDCLALPFIPPNDGDVLETLPQPEGYSAIRELQKEHEVAPSDSAITYQLIDDYIKLGRQEGDPRFYGYAEAMVKPLLQAQKDEPDTMLLVEEANILQHRHDFDSALVVLNKVLRKVPDYAEAHLMRSVIETARGEYDAALADCRSVLSPANGALIGLTCVSMVEGLTGKLQASYDTLKTYYTRFSANGSRDELGWTLSTLGEMAQRLGDNKAAEQFFRTALAVNAKDYYSIASLSDLLLQEKRPDEVVPLLVNYTIQDNLLLRLAMAEDMRHGPKRDQYVEMMQGRIRASIERKETVHLRDYARFALYVEGDKQAAYRMAKENWKTQKEPADAYILIESALAVNDSDTAHVVVAWEKMQKYQDVQFEKYKNL